MRRILKNTNENYGYMINRVRIDQLSKDAIIVVFFLVTTLILLYGSLHSERWLIKIVNVHLSLYFFLFFSLSLYFLILIFYEYFILDSYVIVKDIDINDKLVLTLNFNKYVKLESFYIAYSTRELRGLLRKFSYRKYRKDNHNYIGLKHKQRIYLIPYKNGYRNELIDILDSVNERDYSV